MWYLNLNGVVVLKHAQNTGDEGFYSKISLKCLLFCTIICIIFLVPPGPSGIENDAHDIKKLLLKTQVSLTSLLQSEVKIKHYSAK